MIGLTSLIASKQQPFIYNWSLQPFSLDYDLDCHTTYVKFIHELPDSLKSTPHDRLVRNFS